MTWLIEFGREDGVGRVRKRERGMDGLEHGAKTSVGDKDE